MQITKVALLTNGIYPFAMGGMQKHSYYLARYFAQRAVQVEVYHYPIKDEGSQKISKFFKSAELKYINFNAIPFPNSLYFPGHYVYNSYHHSAKIYEHLKGNNLDVDFIYVQGFTGWKLLQEKKSGKNIPSVGVNFHGLEMFQIAANVRSKLEQHLFRYPVRFCLQKADIAFSLGGKLTNIIEKQVDNGTEIWEIPIGIEKKWLKKKSVSPQSRRKFIFIGRYERRKGIQELNAAIKNIYNECEFDFEFIGPIPEKNRLELPNCHYHGAIYDEDKIIKIVSDGDILVCPSYSEGMPTVILEGMSRGLAVIATDVGAVNELVSAETGWLIKPADINQLIKVLKNSIELPEELLIQKKKAARNLIKKNFTWNNVMDITLERVKNYLNRRF